MKENHKNFVNQLITNLLINLLSSSQKFKKSICNYLRNITIPHIICSFILE